jgi:hypothetical protein
LFLRQEQYPNVRGSWCQKGHGKKILLTKSMSYVVSDNMSSHRSFSKDGVKPLIVGGDFLN